jgi:predicted Zn finger-like uncharacterized protein
MGEWPAEAPRHDDTEDNDGERNPVMIVACASCGAKYRYEESRFDGKASKRIRCTKCETVFEVLNPEVGLRPEPRPEPPAVNPAPVGGDTTQMRRPEHENPPPSETTKQYVMAKLRAALPAQNLKLPAGKKLSLAVISGADSGRNFPIEKPRVVIGRSGADVSLSDSEISREHAAVEIADDIVTLVDLASTNGTFVNGTRIERADLENYGEFEVGGTTLMLIVTGETI